MKKVIIFFSAFVISPAVSFADSQPTLVDVEKQQPERLSNNFSDSGQTPNPTQPDMGNASNPSNIAPSSALIPAPPAMALPPPAGLGLSCGLPLSWRSRAWALAKENPLKKNSFAWAMPVSYSKGLLLLKAAIDKLGLIVSSEYDDAGQFLISIPDSNKKGQIILVSQPVSDRSTLFKMHVYTDFQLFDSKKINCLPGIMQELLENRGLLQ